MTFPFCVSGMMVLWDDFLFWVGSLFCLVSPPRLATRQFFGGIRGLSEFGETNRMPFVDAEKGGYNGV
jgi:hypothetical protein